MALYLEHELGFKSVRDLQPWCRSTRSRFGLVRSYAGQ